MTVHFTETAGWASFTVTAAALWLVFVFAAIQRPAAAKGTRQRYVLTTAQWALSVPAFLAPLRHSIEWAATGHGWDFILGAALSGYWGLVTVRLLRDDDDNWFRRTRNRVRLWARTRAAALTPTPAPHGA